MTLAAIIPLIILVGIISSFIASIIGLGGGLVAIPLIMLVIGEHSLEAKLISYASIVFLSIVAIFSYTKLKKKPEFNQAILIGLGVIPITVLAELYLGPILNKPELKAYFHFIYLAVVIVVAILINFKDKLKNKKLKNWTLPFFGMVIGLLSGSIGLSGGVLFMPLLVAGLKMDLKKAAATSLVLKLLAASTNLIVAGADGQFALFKEDGVWPYLPLVIIPGALIGSFIGPRVSNKISEKAMKNMFNVVMAAIAAWELIDGILLLTGVM